MRVCPHATRAFRSKLPQLRLQASRFVEQCLRLIAMQPFLELFQMRGFLVYLRKRHLVGAPEPFDLVVVYLFWAAPAFQAAQDDHRPTGPRHWAVPLARGFLDTADFQNAMFQALRQLPDASCPGRNPRQSMVGSRSRGTDAPAPRAECGQGSSDWQSCSHSGAALAARRRREPD